MQFAAPVGAALRLAYSDPPHIMSRSIYLLAILAACAASASAQSCFVGSGGTSVTGALSSTSGGADPLHDEGRTSPQAMGLTFPMAGVASALTHASIDTNGVVYLSGAGGPTGAAASYTYGSLGNLRGLAGSSPRIAPFWQDNQAMPTGWDITAETVPGVSYKVTWLNTTNYLATAPARSFTATLFATGAVEFSYDVFAISATFVGMSAGSAVGATTTPASNFAAGSSSSIPLMWEGFANATSWDLSGKTIRFAPNAAGGYTQTIPCGPTPATHTAYGAGCYTVSDSFYALFADAATASAGLQGQSFTLTNSGATYAIAAGGAFVAPGAGAANVFVTPADDAEALLPLSAPLATPQGPQVTLRVHSNGLISWGGAAQTFPGTTNYTPTPGGFLGAANPAIWFWHDHNEQEPGSGRIVWEEVAGVVYVTWNDVESYASPEVQNRSTIQVQFTLATGQIVVVFQAVDANTSSSFGSATLFGYSPGGPSVDGGSQSLAASLPYTVSTANLTPVALTAAPAPVSTATTGTVVTYTHTGVPETSPGSGLQLGLTILSVGQDLAGTDLAFLGAPGCKLHVASLDATYSFVGVGSTQTNTFTIPPGVPAGFNLYAQGAAIVAANSLPNGQNSLGVVLSNAIASTIQVQ